MTKEDYLLLKAHLEQKRIIVGFNVDDYGNTTVTTGIPKQYNENQLAFKDKKTVSYENHITNKLQKIKTR